MFNGAHSKLKGLVISLFALVTMPLISEASNQAPKFWLPEGYKLSEWPNSCIDLFPARPWLRDDLDDWIARSKVSLVPTIHCPVFGFLVTRFLVDRFLFLSGSTSQTCSHICRQQWSWYHTGNVSIYQRTAVTWH